MRFRRIDPSADAKKFIECFWIAEDASKSPKSRKIIPDGFTEIILHTGDPYRTNLTGRWQRQSRHLLAGQIDKHFLLENTGASAMIGIKLKPTALTHLFSLDMHPLTNKVVDIHSLPGVSFGGVIRNLNSKTSHDLKLEVLNDYFISASLKGKKPPMPVDFAVEEIMKNHGMVTVASLSETAGIGERQLENQFRKFVGLSPKRFARIIRFNYIFHLVEKRQGWSHVAYEAAYYDQSHFIRNFKNFTGESPSEYAFDEKTMANFFLNK